MQELLKARGIKKAFKARRFLGANLKGSEKSNKDEAGSSVQT